MKCLYCRYPSPPVHIPILRTLGNIAAGDVQQTQVFLPTFFIFLVLYVDVCVILQTVQRVQALQSFHYKFCCVQAVIDNQALPRILHLLTAQQTNKAIVRGACWTISNITAGTKEQIQVEMVLDLYVATSVTSNFRAFCFNSLRFHCRLSLMPKYSPHFYRCYQMLNS